MIFAPPIFTPIDARSLTQDKGFDFGSLFSFGTPSNKGAKKMDLGNVVSGAGQGAATGAAVSGGNPIGAAIGAGVGFIDSIFGAKPASGGGGGLTDALKLGLGSIFGGKPSTPNITTQTQAVDQNTSVNVSNVLGGRSFGNVDDAGNFDTFQALADVFAIKDAMEKSNSSAAPSYTTPAILQEAKKFDFKPLLLAGGALAAVYFLTKGGKK